MSFSIASISELAPPFVLGAHQSTSIEEWLYKTLSNNGGVTALVGDRIYEGVVPQEQAYPAISFNEIDEISSYTLTDTVRQVESRVQVSVWATSGVERRQVSEAVKYALDGYRGRSHGKAVQSCFILNNVNVTDLSPGNEPRKLYGKHIDFEITHLTRKPDRTE